jgi:hypothetical protein
MSHRSDTFTYSTQALHETMACLPCIHGNFWCAAAVYADGQEPVWRQLLQHLENSKPTAA